MHTILLEYKISRKELEQDIKNLFNDFIFYFLDDQCQEGTPIQLSKNCSYLKKSIELFIQDEIEGFNKADLLAEYLSAKYECDTVRELSSNLALLEFGTANASQVYLVLNRRNRKFIISDNGIDEESFKLKIVKKLNPL